MSNMRVDVHLCNPVGTSFRGYRPWSASQWCTRLAWCWRAQDFFPRALHQHARLGSCRLYTGVKACRIRALMSISVTQWELRSAGTALGSASLWCARLASCWRGQDLFPRALHQHARLGRCRLYFGARACRIRALMCTSVTQWGLRSAGTALGLLRFGAAGSRRAGGVAGSFSSGTSPARSSG